MTKLFKTSVLVTMLTTFGLSACTPGSGQKDSVNAPNGLMTDLLANPELTTISNQKPEFSWIVNDPDQNEIQTAYQILVASSLSSLNEDIGDMWDSGRVASSTSSNVEYEGTPLT